MFLSLDFVAVDDLLEARLALRKLLLISLITDETDFSNRSLASSGSLSTSTQKTIMIFEMWLEKGIFFFYKIPKSESGTALRLMFFNDDDDLFDARLEVRETIPFSSISSSTR